jgi:hypothetical protein
MCVRADACLKAADEHDHTIPIIDSSECFVGYLALRLLNGFI